MKPRYGATDVGGGDLFSGFLIRFISLLLLVWFAMLAGDNLDCSSFENPLSCKEQLQLNSIDQYQKLKHTDYH